MKFFRENKSNGVRVILRDGSEGLHIKFKKGMPGGYFKENGQIVTFWYN